ATAASDQHNAGPNSSADAGHPWPTSEDRLGYGLDHDLAIVEADRRRRAVGRQRRRDPRGHAAALVDRAVLAVEIGDPKLPTVGVDARVQPAEAPRGDRKLAGVVAAEHDRTLADVEALELVVGRAAELEGRHRQGWKERTRAVRREPQVVGHRRLRERVGLL